MKTNIYFIRHCESDTSVSEDRIRPLTEEGIEKSQDLSRYLEDKGVDIIYSSPYKRTIDTIKYFSNQVKLPIIEVEDFRERKISTGWIDNFDIFSKNQWSDFNYKMEEGESLGEVQNRSIDSLKEILEVNVGKNIAIASHGTALSTIINYYDPSFFFDDFNRIKSIMPFIVKMEFDRDKYLSRELIFLD